MATRARQFAGLITTDNGVVIVKDGRTGAVSRSITISNDSDTAIDTFDGSVYRAVRYIVTAQTALDSNHQTTEILLTHDGTTATTTSYGTLVHGGNTLAFYDASIAGNTVSLIAEPQGFSGLKFRIEKTIIKTV